MHLDKTCTISFSPSKVTGHLNYHWPVWISIVNHFETTTFSAFINNSTNSDRYRSVQEPELLRFMYKFVPLVKEQFITSHQIRLIINNRWLIEFKKDEELDLLQEKIIRRTYFRMSGKLLANLREGVGWALANHQPSVGLSKILRFELRSNRFGKIGNNRWLTEFKKDE